MRITIAHTVLFAFLATRAVDAEGYNKIKARKYISEALPDRAGVEPKNPRRLLVFSKTNGFRHDSISSGVMSLQMLGEKTGAFTAVHSEDAGIFEKESLVTFDAVCMLNTTREVFLPRNMEEMSEGDRKKAIETDERLKANFKSFVEGGKGLIGFHAATDTFYQWADYSLMMGGLFSGHPWHEEIGVKIEEPSHPLVAAFEGKPFKVVDEIYQFKKGFYSRDRLRVLLSLDLSSVKNEGGRDDRDYALAWIRNVGKGRTFYTVFGHRDQIFWNPVLLKFFLDGIQFAMGDIEADATPSKKSEK
ncbi:MAG: ThuA domain-containing protein [Planctomycetota bacterium]|nr:ThuA domain-containing protein [Planctomycetota bacterium]MDA1142800.1 ThuA domain-containing protein [Planctomycetota bacterium]